MSIRNFWSLEPGECFVDEEIQRHTDCDVYFPVRDKGIDLLAVYSNKHVGVQVKESRYYYTSKRRDGHIGSSWHQIKQKNLIEDVNKAGFYVFLTYIPSVGSKRVSEFDIRYLVVPHSILYERMSTKSSGKKKVFSYYFHFEDNFVHDERINEGTEEVDRDYSMYLDAWKLIQEYLT